MSKDIIIGIICLVLALAFVAGSIYLLAGNPAPMTGHIDSKTYHPASYPVEDDTPWVYALGITSTDGRRATTWIVDKATYDRYSVGDMVKRGRN